MSPDASSLQEIDSEDLDSIEDEKEKKESPEKNEKKQLAKPTQSRYSIKPLSHRKASMLEDNSKCIHD